MARFRNRFGRRFRRFRSFRPGWRRPSNFGFSANVKTPSLLILALLAGGYFLFREKINGLFAK